MRHGHQRDGKQVTAESRLDPGGVDGAGTRTGRIEDRTAISLRQRAALVDEPGHGGRDDILPCRQDATEVLQGLLGARTGRAGIDHTVEIPPEQLVHVAGGSYSEWLDSGERSRVLAIFALRMDPHSHELEVRPIGDRADGIPPDAACGPHDHLVRLLPRAFLNCRHCGPPSSSDVHEGS